MVSYIENITPVSRGFNLETDLPVSLKALDIDPHPLDMDEEGKTCEVSQIKASESWSSPDWRQAFGENIPIYDIGSQLLWNNRFSKKVQNWKGIVQDFNEDYFTAELYDLTAGGTKEVAEFYLEDVSPEDLSLLKNGAVFYWTVGYFMENSQIVKKSEIRFQRLITLNEFEVDSALKRAEDLFKNLKIVPDGAAESTQAK